MKTIGINSAKRKYKQKVSSGDLVKVPSEMGELLGIVRRTHTDYVYNWIYVEWPDGTIRQHIISKVEKVS